ncbi:hypothetical protein CEXT_427431 [Caerostris extrusa]|uniref:Uncharacterized protein n=1 Tax=Caerostris extrusa TaxID=172846 RepID=A0AAV4XF98_CAEEX|nr:hypothetical protein CEXT_427431 [Caerostris extrusa]
MQMRRTTRKREAGAVTEVNHSGLSGLAKAVLSPLKYGFLSIKPISRPRGETLLCSASPTDEHASRRRSFDRGGS